MQNHEGKGFAKTCGAWWILCRVLGAESPWRTVCNSGKNLNPAPAKSGRLVLDLWGLGARVIGVHPCHKAANCGLRFLAKRPARIQPEKAETDEK